MKVFLLTTLMTVSNLAVAQNLVSNSGFETFSTLPSGPGQYANATGWSNCNGGGSPDYFHMNGGALVDLPVCFIGTLNPYSGDAIMGFCPYYNIPEFREYLTTQLTSALIPGNSYSVSFYITSGVNSGGYCGQGIDKVSVAFSVGAFTQSGWAVIPSVTPQWTTPGILYDTTWEQITFQFIAADAYDHITFGSFVDDASTTAQTFVSTPSPGAYYFIDEIEVQPDSASQINFIASENFFCESTCIDFTDQSSNNATSWQWLFPGGTPDTSSMQNPTAICYSVPGTYDVTLITTGASGVDSLTLPSFITVNANPSAPVITSSNDTLYCSAASSYQWYLNAAIINGATGQSTVATQSGMYTVEVTDGNGCSASSDFLFSMVAFNATDTSLCEKFCISFFDQSLNNPTGWQWGFEGGSPSSSSDQNPANICYDVPGTYDVTLITTDANGNDTIILEKYIAVYPTPPFPTITQIGYELISSPSSSYQWQFNSGDIPGATNQSYNVLQTGYYTVVVGDSNGCVNSVSKYILITWIEDVTGDADISIYPNPSSGSFMVEFSYAYASTYAEASVDGPGNRLVEIKVVNILEQIIFSSSESRATGSSLFKRTIDLHDVARGLYFIEIKTGNTFVRKKIVIAE